MTTSAYDLIYDTIGNEVWDEMGTAYRVEDIRAIKTLTGYYEYSFGLQRLGDLIKPPIIYVNLDRYDQLCQN